MTERERMMTFRYVDWRYTRDDIRSRGASVKTVGVDIADNDTDRCIQLIPVTSKARHAVRGELCVPYEAIPELVAALRKIYAGPLEAQIIEMEEKDGVGSSK